MSTFTVEYIGNTLRHFDTLVREGLHDGNIMEVMVTLGPEMVGWLKYIKMLLTPHRNFFIHIASSWGALKRSPSINPSLYMGSAETTGTTTTNQDSWRHNEKH